MGKKNFNNKNFNPQLKRKNINFKLTEKPKIIEYDKKEEMLKLVLQSKISNNTVLTFQHKNSLKMTLVEGYQNLKKMIELMSLNVRRIFVNSELEKFYESSNKTLPSKLNQANLYLKALLIGNVLDEKIIEDTGKYISIDCEMVGCGARGKNSVLGRVSMVNYYGHIILDTFVNPKVTVTDYRTFVSGIEAKHLENAPNINEVLNQVKEICKDKIIVGHSIKSDLKVLRLENHPYIHIRDTAKFKPLLLANSMKSPSLKTLAYNFLDIEIQTADHSSVEDAQATMALFRLFQGLWEDPKTGDIKDDFLPKSLQRKKNAIVENTSIEIVETSQNRKQVIIENNTIEITENSQNEKEIVAENSNTVE